LAFLLLSEIGRLAGGFVAWLPIGRKPDWQNKSKRNFYEQPNRFHGFALFLVQNQNAGRGFLIEAWRALVARLESG
jgi:hypothetical protein